MQVEEFLKNLDSSKLALVYLFAGDSPFAVEDAWKRLLAKVFPNKPKKFNGERVQAKEITAGQVIERLSTVPMFGAKRVLMVEHVEAWNKEDRTALESFLPRIPPSVCLVLTFTGGKKDIEGISKAAESRGKVVQFKAPSAKDAPRWLMDRAKERGKTLSYRAAFLLVEMNGADFNSLSSELEKLCTFVGQGGNIEVEDIEAAGSTQRSFSMFDLLDQIKARQAGKAVKSLRSLILAGEAPLKILSSLAWQIRVLWQVKDGLEMGLSEAKLTERLKLHSFVVKKSSEQVARFSESDLHAILDAVRQADVAIKSTGSSPELVLESLVIELCLATKKPSNSLRGH